MPHVQACPRHPVASLPPSLIPAKFIEALEQNQQIASCCRHPENHDIEALYSSDDYRNGINPLGVRFGPPGQPPDIYIFHCTCGRQHRRFCVGGGDQRPFWEVR